MRAGLGIHVTLPEPFKHSDIDRNGSESDQCLGGEGNKIASSSSHHKHTGRRGIELSPCSSELLRRLRHPGDLEERYRHV